jgi:hypothetical protein
MVREFLQTMFVVGLLGSIAEAQQAIFVGAGSTPQGDYLRGVGIAAWGMGIYNEKTAIAGQINANTFMTLNEYFAAVARSEGYEHALRRKEELSKISKFRQQIQERIHNNPELRDVLDGDALNSMLTDLTNPGVSDSTSHYYRVPLDADVIRRIPFKLGEKGATFSMNRLSMKGKKKWAVKFQDPSFRPICEAYQRAVENALDLAIDGKMKQEAITAVEKAVDDLETKLKGTPEVYDPRNQHLYSDAKAQLDVLQKTERLFMDLPIQRVLGEVDNYSGTTVDELRRFMRRHGLSFAGAETPDERDLYSKLHTALKVQNEKLTLPEPQSK